MSTVIETPRPVPAELPSRVEHREQYLRLSCVPWESYLQVLHGLDGHHLRITYDRGELEIMTVSAGHERHKKILARLLEALTEELDIPVLGLGNFTFKREDLKRGMEPDECWYIRHEAQMRDRDTVDFSVDPPPDLVVEVEVSQSALNRMGILAALGVPEVWRYDGESLHVHVFEQGRYVERESSPTFPKLSLARLGEFLRQRGRIDETSLVKGFRDYVRREVRG